MDIDLSADQKTVTMRGDYWNDSFPVEALPEKIKFYRSLAARKQGRYRRHYQPTVDGLEAVVRSIAANAKK